ncbi:MAG: chromosomal replication initiator protein DnaA [Bacilli bacterium]
MTSSGGALWQQALHTLNAKLSKEIFETWLAATEVHHSDPQTLMISVPTAVALDHINKHLLPAIVQTVNMLAGHPVEVSFVRVEPAKKVTGGGSNSGNQSAEDDYAGQQHQFNSKYTFDTFVIGERNRLAHAASVAVSEKPAQNYNPFFMYGGVGLGKTHLMHAIGQHALELNASARVVYITSETFLNEFVTALQTSTIDEFRNKYRKVDILLIDDIQFISGKESTQEEFFHTFNALHGDHKQIVITSDRPPKAIEHLEDRLRSRFSGGLIIDIKPPEFETRVAILRKKAKAEGIEISNDVLSLIASKVETNVRELAGALIRVIAFSSMMNRDIDTMLVEEALIDIAPENSKRPLSILDVQKVVCTHYHLRIDDLVSRSRQKDIAYPRQIAMYLARKLTGLSLPKIGKEFGGRDHTTVLYAYDKITSEINSDGRMEQLIRQLTDNLDVHTTRG